MAGLDKQRVILEQIARNPTERHDPLLLHGIHVSCIEPIQGFSCKHAQILRRLGLGTHAEVYEVVPDSMNSISFAMKIEKPIKQAHGFLMKEIEILKQLSAAKCVPRYLGAFSVEIAGIDCLACGMELFEDSLSSLKHGRKEMQSVHRAHLIDWLSLELFDCVFQLHAAGYLHRDIKPSNFLFKQDSYSFPRIVAVDFGSAKAIGEPNETPFRGTGAYASITLDPFQSKPEDDYWSVIFSIMELGFDGGLPWRSISARSEEGRTELTKQKIELLDALGPGVSRSEHNLLSQLTDMVTDLAVRLYRSTVSDSAELEKFCAHVHELRSTLEFDKEIIYISLRPPFKQLSRPIHSVASFMHGENRSVILDSLPQGGSVLVNCNSCDPKVLRALCTAVSTSNSTQAVFEDQPVCLSELLEGVCREGSRCPLFHIPFKGIQLSAITRVLRQRVVCPFSALGKCTEKNCSLLQLTSAVISSIYKEGRFPNPHSSHNRATQE